MTSRQRVEAALRHQQPDRTPIFEYVLIAPWVDSLLGRPFARRPDNWAGLVQANGWQRAVSQLAEDYLDLAGLLGHDMLTVKPNAPPAGVTVSRTPAVAPEPASDDPVETIRQRNQRWSSTLAPPPDECFLVYRHLRRLMCERDVDLPILAPAYEHGIWTDVNLMQTMVLEPDVACEHFALATRQALASVERYAELGLDQVGVGGDFAGTRLLISPEAYRRFIVPEVREVSRRVHEAGMWAVNASDGDLWPVIDDFLSGCEVDGYLEIDFHAGMDLARLKAAHGRQVTFYGNLDCGNVLSLGSPAEVRRHTIDCLDAGMGDGGHILTASNAIIASVPLDNYLTVVSSYRDYFGIDPLTL